jgi:alkanesulfonate monooxygenase SsuD/methylene tetrahydromethanopterin reductase-like flavin-dependent oxidoreductase (luciferase family)
MRHKIDVLKGHCDAVGRDISEIEFTLGCKPTIRKSEADARKVWMQNMERNKTPMSRVENDDTFWNGSAEQIAEKMRAYRDLGFRTYLAEVPAPYDDETLERWIGEVKPMVEKVAHGLQGRLTGAPTSADR